MIALKDSFTLPRYRLCDTFGGQDGHMHPIDMLRATRGATSIEYGLIAALIAVAAITAMSSVGKNLKTTFTNVGNNMKVS